MPFGIALPLSVAKGLYTRYRLFRVVELLAIVPMSFRESDAIMLPIHPNGDTGGRVHRAILQGLTVWVMRATRLADKIQGIPFSFTRVVRLREFRFVWGALRVRVFVVVFASAALTRRRKPA